MNCCPINDIYEYIEASLPAGRRQKMEAHLKACPKCRRAVEERQRIAAAAFSLPPLEVPADFTDGVMSRIGPARTRFPVWLIILASFSSLLALGSVALIASGKNLIGTALGASHSLWEYAKNAAVLTAKVMTLLSLTGKTVRSLFESAARGLSAADALISPALLAVILILMTVLAISLGLAARKKTSLGDEP
jgi:anti-sigma factor RsiW